MTKISIRVFLAAIVAFSFGCGDDGSPTGDSSITVDSGGGDGGGGDGGTDGGDRDAAPTDGSAGDGAPADASATDSDVPDGNDASVGCVGGTCPEGLMCCTGVPYPEEGLCAEMCTMRSDRHAKEDFEVVDADEILARLASLPITEWSYRDEAGGVRHVGPMAQDFHRSFGVGGSDRVIHPVDASGVTIAAIQALARRVEALERENAALRDHTRSLEARIRSR